jgi:DNA-binding beta-propeller fold protein YncE
MTKTTTLSTAILLIAATSCHSGNDDPPRAAPSGATAVGSAAPPASAAPTASAGSATASKGVAVREGNAIARAPESDALYVADEDHGVVRAIALPAEIKPKHADFKAPGAPAQVLAIGDRLLVTVRQVGQGAGALLVLERHGLDLKEASRVELPVDAWGVSVTPDDKIALVTSAWSHQLSAVDLATSKVLWSVDTAREPRGIAVLPNGNAGGYRAYVSHLVGSDVTRVDFAASGAPTLKRVELPAAPLQSPANTKLSASLGYTVIAGPKGDRAYFPRIALGALGPSSWFGEGAVDVLSTDHDVPRAPARSARPTAHFAGLVEKDMDQPSGRWIDGATPAFSRSSAPTQPRAAAYRRKSDTLLVVDEGFNSLTELDALAMAPALVATRRYSLGKKDDPSLHLPEHGAAPAGIALSEDEDKAYVFCRASYDVMIVKLSPTDGSYTSSPPVAVTLGAEEDKNHNGRSLFYAANVDDVSGGLACSGCHPEGRDDGHTWHEARLHIGERTVTTFLAGNDLSVLTSRWGDLKAEGTGGVGYARQTPIIAGRLKAAGPYGWHGESATLEARLTAGFDLHRWDSGSSNKSMIGAYAKELMSFVRVGLTPPPRVERALTDEEQKGRALFESPATLCATCHLPASEYTDRNNAPLKTWKAPAGFADDPNPGFKTPSLLYVGGSPPYLHDGRFETLESLIELNQDHMGKTAQLSPDERKALIAFLRTL